MSDSVPNGHDAAAPLAPSPAYYPITKETRCGNCRILLISEDGTLPKGAEWSIDGWYCKRCMQTACRQKKYAERLGQGALPLAREQYADEVAGRFGFPPYYTAESNHTE